MQLFLTILSLIISTIAALFLGERFPILGNSIFAILIGAIVRHTPFYNYLDKRITKFISSYFLKAGIVLLGLTLSLRIVAEVGFGVLILLGMGVIVSIGLSLILKRIFRIDSYMALLIGIGTSICGGAAIVATAPIVEAEEKDIAVSITTMLIYSMLALILLPIIGHLFNHTDQMYGVFAGAAVNDTASVVATAYSWSNQAGGFATITKLTRTLFLIPVTLGVIFANFKQQSSGTNEKLTISFKQIVDLVPLFVILFLIAVIIATLYPIPPSILEGVNHLSKLLMTLALVTIGLGVHLKDIKAAGIKPIIIGGVCWLGVVINALIFIHWLY